jgi:hypothetical protein
MGLGHQLQAGGAVNHLRLLRARRLAARNAAPGSATWSDPEAWTDEDEQRLQELEQGAEPEEEEDADA